MTKLSMGSFDVAGVVTAAQWDAQLERQRGLEDQAIGRGRERFERRLEKARERNRMGTQGASLRLMQDAVNALDQGLTAIVEAPRGRGAEHYALRWIRKVGVEHAAFATVGTVLDRIHSRPTANVLAREIAAKILDELHARRVEKEAPGLFRYRMNSFQTTSRVHMARSLRQAGSYAGVDASDLELTGPERIKLGVYLLDRFIEATGLVEREREVSFKVTGRKKTRRQDENRIVATEETREWMAQRNETMAGLSPVRLPMVVPPLPWGPGERGGYRFSLRGRFALARGTSKGHQRTLEGTQMPTVYSALNRIQETPWRINRRVFDVMREMVERGGDVAGLPRMEPLPEPAKPHDIDSNGAARRAWRKAAGEVKTDNHRRELNVMGFRRVLDAAQEVVDEAAIWFPHNLDFRGRVYPVSETLSPQGDDIQKGLLTFSEGAPMGDSGAIHLALHGANCLGKWKGQKVSRLSLQERLDLIMGMTQEIIATAADPIENRLWTEAEEPWQFLAFAFEWAGFAKLHAMGRGGEYVCSLPVAADGSCNGIQHFAAMFRSEVDGEAVNVVPQDRPQDIYQRVADVVLSSLEREAVDSDLARLWLTSGLVDRSLCKRPTMTFGYGSKQFGFRGQLLEDLQSRPEWRQIKRHFTVEVVNEESGLVSERSLVGPACGYMAKLIWGALGAVVVAAFEGMAWMQSSARQVCKAGKPVEWTVPFTGFRVRQEYWEMKTKQVETKLEGSFIWLVDRTPTGKVEAFRQANGVAPNVIHSLDAAALMLTVEMASAEGVESFGMVHDSYATIPAHAEVLARCTRQAFVRLYQHEVAEDLAQQWAAQAPEGAEMPEIPGKGNLDLSGVLASDYFFC